ncbi:Flp family type IVb pilin [Orbus sturtevantii]|uniref:Flp family type IVb pilin n=1 Tax=Orbus sturtevantii TaxID=3074109 RepID=UPI00370D23D7
MKLNNFTNKFVRNEAGVTAIEYAIVAVGVTVVVTFVFGEPGPESEMLTNIFNTLSTQLVNLIN